MLVRATWLPRCWENCLDSQHVWLGAALVQAVEVPLSPLLRGESLVHALNDSRSKVIAVAEEFHRHIEAVSERLRHLERIVIMQSAEVPPESAFDIINRDDLISQSVATTDFVLPQPKDIACVVYTSGTTGPSKGVLINLGSIECHGGINRRLLVRRCRSLLLHWCSQSYPSRTQPLLMASVGGRFVMRPSFKTEEFWADIDRYACTVTMPAWCHGPLYDEPAPSFG